MSCQWFTASNTVETIHRRSLSETIQWTLTMNEYLAVPLASLQLLQQYLMFTLCLSRYFYVCKSSGLKINALSCIRIARLFQVAVYLLLMVSLINIWS